MTITSQPWPASGGTPTYSDIQWKTMLNLFGNAGSSGNNVGVIQKHGSASPLKVVPDDPAAMAVDVQPGEAMVNGLFVKSTAVENVSIDAANPTYGRYDVITLRSDSTNGSETVTVHYIKGTAAATPTIPSMTQDGSPYFDIPLATIYVGAGVTSITSTVIIDTRRFWNGGTDRYEPFLVDNNGPSSAVAVGDIACLFSNSNAVPTIQAVGDGSPAAGRHVIGVVVEVGAKGAYALVKTKGLHFFQVSTGIDPKLGNLVYATTGADKIAMAPDADTLLNPIGIAVGYVNTGAVPGVWVYVDPMALWLVPRIKQIEASADQVISTSSPTDLTIFGSTPITFSVRHGFALRCTIFGNGEPNTAGARANVYTRFTCTSATATIYDHVMWSQEFDATREEWIHGERIFYPSSLWVPTYAPQVINVEITPKADVSAGTFTLRQYSGSKTGTAAKMMLQLEEKPMMFL